MWKCALLKKAKNPQQKKFKLIFSRTVKKLNKNCSRHNSMPEKCRTWFKYENSRYISWDNELTTLRFTQMRWRVENGDVLGRTTSQFLISMGNTRSLILQGHTQIILSPSWEDLWNTQVIHTYDHLEVYVQTSP